MPLREFGELSNSSGKGQLLMSAPCWPVRACVRPAVHVEAGLGRETNTSEALMWFAPYFSVLPFDIPFIILFPGMVNPSSHF